MAQPFQSPSGIFQLRRKVPLELRAVLGYEYKRTLGTRDPAEAKAKFAEEWSRSEEAFSLARAQAIGVDTLTARDTQQLAARWFRDALVKSEATGDFSQWLVTGPSVAYSHGDHEEEHSPLVSLREALDSDPDWNINPHLDESIRATLRASAVPMPSDAAAMEGLRSAFRAHWLKLSDLAARRHEGDWLAKSSVLPEEPLSFEAKRTGGKGATKLLALFETYRADKILNDGNGRAVVKTVDSYKATVVQFIELCGDVPIQQIDRLMIREYRGLLAQLPVKGEGIRKLSARQQIAKAEAEGLPRLTEPTIRNKLKALSSVLSHGVLLGQLTENPVIVGGAAKAASKAATRRSATMRRRKDFNTEELTAIFSSPIYTDSSWSAPRAKFGKAWYWMPLLMYYTGARREELAQLLVRDIVRMQGKAPYLSILATDDEDDGDRTVKTVGSRRLIPLHADLIKLGLLDYIDELPKAEGQLFPLLTPNPSGYYGANFGKRWAEYLRNVVKLETSVNPSHGFRHTFKTLCRGAGIAEDVQDAITGHAAGSVARGYGEMPIGRMAAEMERFPSLTPLVPIIQSR